MDLTGYLKVGRLVGTHGIRGEVRVISDTDFPEHRFASGNQLILIHPELKEPFPLTIELCRPHKAAYLIKFREWDNINQVEPYKGGLLAVKDNDLAPINEDEGEYYYHQIIGCEVITTDGRHLGKVKEILSLPANDVWVVDDREFKKEILLPFIADVVKEVNIEQQRITIQWMEGLGE